MSILSAIVGFASSGVSAVISAVSSLGPAVSTFVTGIADTIGTVLDRLGPVAEALGRFANAFLQGLGVLKPDEKIEDMGERALQAAEHGTTPDKYENFDQYMDALRNFEIDPEKAKQRSTAEKLTAGLAIATPALEDKFHYDRGVLNSLWLLPMTNPEFFTPERMQSIIATGRFAGNVFEYLEQKLSGKGMDKLSESIADGLPASDPAKESVNDALENARGHWESIKSQIADQRSNG